MVTLPAARFLMGCDHAPYPDDGEGPVREIALDAFGISSTAVTNAQFAAFVAATGYQTDAERFGWSFVFAGLLPDDHPPTRAATAAPWWRAVGGAAWHSPESPGSVVGDRFDHPVVHVSHNDALAYCHWRGARLPTEAEWEYAARGGLHGAPYPWGAEREPGRRHRMNVWQGIFPTHNTSADGYVATAPVDAYPPNAFGLFNMTGNVWEWCADWFTRFHSGVPKVGPTGPRRGQERVLRGGSYLCHASYCFRYRTSARMGNTPDTSAGNIGFRCADAVNQ